MTRFSILMTNYNMAKFIPQAVKSILKQTCSNWELIFVDDLSSDNSVDVLRPFLKDKRIKFIQRKENGGYGAALRTAAEHVTGEIMCVVDSDDGIKKIALDRVDKAYRDNPDAGMIYTQYMKCDEKLRRIGPGDCGHIPKGKTWLEVLKSKEKPRPRVGHLKTFKKFAYDLTEGFADMRKTLDKDIALKLEEITELMFLDEELYYYRVHKGNLSRSPTSNVKNVTESAKERRKLPVWELKAQNYFKQFERKLPHPSRRYIQDLASKSEMQTMLELGFGGADIPMAIKSRDIDIKYTGLDCTASFVERAKNIYGKDARFTFMEGDMEKLPFAGPVFDIVYTRHTLEHLPYYEEAFKEMVRVAKKRVVVVLFHEFTKKDKIVNERHKVRYLNCYEKKKFMAFVGKLVRKHEMFRTPATSKWGANLILDCYT